MGIERPLFLILLIFVAAAFYYLLKSKRKNYVIYPLTGYLKKKKMPKPGWLRHLPLYLILLSACSLTVASSKPYKGYEQVKKVIQVREISPVLDFSGSMEGDPLKKLIQVIQHLMMMKKRPKDIFHITLFAGQAKTTPGLSGRLSELVTIDSIKRSEEKMGKKLGSSTGVGIGLFNAFHNIALRNRVFSKKELEQIADLLLNKQDETVFILVNERTRALLVEKTKKQNLEEKEKLFKNQALILISDFEFPHDPLINPETMLKIMKDLGIKIFLIRIGESDISHFNKLSPLAEESGGKFYSVKIGHEVRNDQRIEKVSEGELAGIFEEIDEIAKAPTVEKIEPLRDYKDIYFIWTGLGLFVVSIALRIFKKFREVP